MANKYYAREFDKDRDYEAVKRWWEARDMTPIPPHALPKLGIVACETPDGDAMAVAWLFMDNSIGLAHIDWLLTQPKMQGIKAVQALEAVIECLMASAKELGYTVIMAITTPKIAKAAKRFGWSVAMKDLVAIVKQ